MKENAYRVVYYGKFAERMDLGTTKANLAKIFSVDVQKIEKIFSAKRSVIKNNIPHETALKYQKVLKNAGVLTEIESISGPEPQISTKQIMCPKCGFSQEEASECVKCNINISEYTRLQNEGPQEISPNLSKGAANDINIWKEKNKVKLLLSHRAFPKRCITCNMPTTDKFIKRKIYFIPPITYIGLLAGLLPLIILYYVLRKEVNLEYYFCKKHAQKRLMTLLFMNGGIIIGIFLIFASIGFDSGFIALFGVFVFLVSLIAGNIILPSNPSVIKIDTTHAWLKGPGKVFINSLPNVRENNNIQN